MYGTTAFDLRRAPIDDLNCWYTQLPYPGSLQAIFHTQDDATQNRYTHIYIYIYEYLCIDKYAMICNIVPNSKIYPQKVETRRFTFRAIEQTVGTMGLLRMTRIAGSHGSRVDWWIVLFPKRWGGWRPGYWDGEKLWEKPMTLIRLGC